MMYLTQNEEKLSTLFNELVPVVGKAESLAGELVRAAMRLCYRFFNDGDRIGIGYGNETCNAAARFLMNHTDPITQYMVQAIWGATHEGFYETMLNIVIGRIVEYVDSHPELRETETDDMFSYSDTTADCAYLDDDDEEYE